MAVEDVTILNKTQDSRRWEYEVQFDGAKTLRGRITIPDPLPPEYQNGRAYVVGVISYQITRQRKMAEREQDRQTEDSQWVNLSADGPEAALLLSNLQTVLDG